MQNLSLNQTLDGRSDFFISLSTHSPYLSSEVHENENRLYYATGIHYAPHNGIFEKEPERVLSDQEIDESVAFFANRKLPFIWWTSCPKLLERGFQYGGILTGVSLDISSYLPPVLTFPFNLEVKEVEAEEECQRFTELASHAFGLTDLAESEWKPINHAVMLQGVQRHFLAYIDETAVGAITLCLSESVAGIWNLCTFPDYRKSGIGSALVNKALEEAQRKGQTNVMAILMPKGLAWNLLANFGFEKSCEFPFYIYGSSAENLEK